MVKKKLHELIAMAQAGESFQAKALFGISSIHTPGSWHDSKWFLFHQGSEKYPRIWLNEEVCGDWEYQQIKQKEENG